MTNFDRNRDAARIIEQVFKLIDEKYLYQFIDQRIEEAAVEFEFDRNAPTTHQTFIRIIGDFVHHIYKNGLCIRQTLSVTQARAEAMAILEEVSGSQLDPQMVAAFKKAYKAGLTKEKEEASC